MEKGKTLIDEQTLAARINELAAAITKDFEGEELTLVCILKGSIYFFADLSRKIDLDTRLEFIRVSSYEGHDSTGTVEFKLKLDKPLTNKNVVVVEDIIDSGTTIKALLEYFETQNPKQLKLCALLDKPSRRTVEGINIDYLGFTINNHYVIGYGLDDDEKYRTIPTINCIPLSEEDSKSIEEDCLKLKMKY